MSYEEQNVIWRVALASYDPREMRVWTRYLEERNPAIRCTGYRSSQPLLERRRHLGRGEDREFEVLIALPAQRGQADLLEEIEPLLQPVGGIEHAFAVFKIVVLPRLPDIAAAEIGKSHIPEYARR